MRDKIQFPRIWFTVLSWVIAIGSLLGNLVILIYIGWTRLLTGAAYAQADLGLFMLLVPIGTPIALLSIGVFVLGCVLCPPSIELSASGIRRPLVVLLAINLGLLGAWWIYLLFLMP